jgi:hypothetical protein
MEDQITAMATITKLHKIDNLICEEEIFFRHQSVNKAYYIAIILLLYCYYIAIISVHCDSGYVMTETPTLIV